MLELGAEAPDFDLPEVRGGRVSLNDLHGKKVLVVMFISKHCPYVQHVKQELARFGVDYHRPDVGIVAIGSNDVKNYPDDSPENLARMAEEEGFTFPVCYDETQEVAKAYRAACTPDFFVFDGSHRLVYRGQLDDSRPGNGEPLTGKDLRAAVAALLSGSQVNPEQRPSIGCNIKWKPGQEPDYFAV